MIIFILVLIGIVGIAVGLWSIIYLRQFKRSEYVPHNWKKIRVGVLLIAVLLGLSSWPGTHWMGYPFAGEADKDIGRIVGIPFFVSYFDGDGQEYKGPFSVINTFLNSFFWFFVPNVVLFVYAKHWKQRIINSCPNASQARRGR